jgi:hypothetical protein
MGIILEGNFINMISLGSNSLEKNQKEQEYIDYIETHRENVRKAYDKYFAPLLNTEVNLNSCSNEEFQIALKDSINNIDIHDESKYSDIEFEPYRLKWYPTDDEKLAIREPDIAIQLYEDYDAATYHHVKNNPHHTAFWVQEDGSIKDMNLKYIIEMLCDWLSFGNDIRVWYKNKAEKERNEMSTRTKEIVEELMDLIYTKQN